MQTKVSILRGINVGGKRKILMKDLRNLLSKNGFNNVKTYIQSGNVFYQSESSNLENSKTITDLIRSNYNFEVPVITLTADAIKECYNNSPFQNAPETSLYVTFLEYEINPSELSKLDGEKYKPDLFTLGKSCIYLKIEGPSHKSKLTNNLFEKQLNLIATTRNWKTVRKLVEITNTF